MSTPRGGHHYVGEGHGLVSAVGASRLQRNRRARAVEQVPEDVDQLVPLAELSQHEAGELVRHDEVIGPAGCGEGRVALVQQLGHHSNRSQLLFLTNLAERQQREQSEGVSLISGHRVTVSQHDHLMER